MGRSLSLVFVLLLIAAGVVAQVSPCLADKRVALVIGNSKYKNTPSLVNPENDATDVAEALRVVGFQVTLKLDAEKRQMDQAVAQFAREASDSDAALFYYAGHGMQFEGHNYVMPVDAELQDEISLRYEMTSIEDVKAALERSNGVKIMVLDACRNNPLAAKLVRSISAVSRDIPNVQGYARPEKTRGMIVVYATQADDVANDGAGRNSPFSTAFLKEIKEPGVEIGTMFRRIGGDVYQATNGHQSPELSISLVPEYYLNQSETDQTIWARIRVTTDSAIIQKFIERYPGSFYAPDAKARLDLLEREARDKTGARLHPDEKAEDAGGTTSPAAVAAQKEQERIAGEAKAREEALAAKLAAAETDRQNLARELAEREASQRQAEIARAEAARQEVAGLELQAAQAKIEASTAGRKAADTKSPPAMDLKVAEAKPTATNAAPSPLSAEQTVLMAPIQSELRRLGCFGGSGDWTSSDMQRTVAKYARYAKLATPPASPSAEFLESLKNKQDRVCPSECSAREVESGDRCVAKTCGPGEYLAGNGLCVVLPAAAPKRLATRREATKPVTSSSKGHCFSFNGSQYCE
jgi:Caspase domain